MSIADRLNKEIEDVAAWPWRRKYAYAIAFGTLEGDVDDMDMPDTNVGSGNTPSMPSGAKGKMPKGGAPSTGSVSKGTHPAVAKHDHVMHVQNGN